MSLPGRLYIWAITVAGSAALAYAAGTLFLAHVAHGWLVLAALTVLSGSFPIKVPSIPATISVSETFVFVAVLLFGTPAATVIVALDAVVMSVQSVQRQNRKLEKILFNATQASLSIWFASEVFWHLSGGNLPGTESSGPFIMFWPILVLSTSYFLLTSCLTAIAVAFETHDSPVHIWRKHFVWLSLNSFVGASIAALLVRSSTSIDMSMIGAIVPLVVVSYLTFKFSLGRVEDAEKHLAQVNNLYLSAIETLAMAVDAKDQTTHGHIRRVQAYAVGLAEEMGIRNPTEITALQAAALLHDVGKLAVPDYILNKPGELTAAERDRMKLHANVGADILSSINFPYSVVPLVRHHHERWDGTGYPAGLAGTDIPLGARILAVVDCFDALTSDRPYRPKLSARESLEFLAEHRGSMYDPVIVDTFMRIYPRLTTVVEDAGFGRTQDVLSHIGDASQSSVKDELPPFENITSSTEEMIELYSLAKSVAGHVSLGDTADMIAKHLKRLVPANLCVFYVKSETGTHLIARHAVGDSAGLVKDFRIEIGERLSGWVAAHRQTIVNSDPALDFGDMARRTVPRLRSSISVPLLHEGDLVGALTLYGERSDQFTDNHQRLLEAVGGQVSYAVRSALSFERDFMSRHPSTGLLSYTHLERIGNYEMKVNERDRSAAVAVLLQLNALVLLGTDHGMLMKFVADAAKRCLRAADMLFQYSDSQLVIVLAQIERAQAVDVAERIIASISAVMSGGSRMAVRAAITTAMACAPEDGHSLMDLVAAAERRLSHSILVPGASQKSIH